MPKDIRNPHENGSTDGEKPAPENPHFINEMHGHVIDAITADGTMRSMGLQIASQPVNDRDVPETTLTYVLDIDEVTIIIGGLVRGAREAWGPEALREKIGKAFK